MAKHIFTFKKQEIRQYDGHSKRPDKTGNFGGKKNKKSRASCFIRYRLFFSILQMAIYVPRKLTSLSRQRQAHAGWCNIPLNSTGGGGGGGGARLFLRTDAQSHSLSFIQRPAIHQCAHCCHEQRDRALSKSPPTQIWFTSICLKEWRARARSANTAWHLRLPTGMCLFSSVSNPGSCLNLIYLRMVLDYTEDEVMKMNCEVQCYCGGASQGSAAGNQRACARACLHILAS